jgi:hypothetical protein
LVMVVGFVIRGGGILLLGGCGEWWVVFVVGLGGRGIIVD